MTSRRPFRSAVPFYVAGRLDYPTELLTEVTAALPLEPGGRVLDLGCGPGFLALGFAGLGCDVVAMDPEPEMLAAARAAAAAASQPITFVQGSSNELSPDLGRFRLVTMGRSFHWMDREKTLIALDLLIEPGGGIALFRDVQPECPENDWQKAWRVVRHRYAPEPKNRTKRWADPEDGHEAVLRGSAFPVLRHLTQRYRRRTSIAQLVTRSLSMSSSTPEALGSARASFEADLVAALTPFSHDGMLDEIVEAEALLARRP
jgi:2-polyprenyl-3-methyl-5-hydroxy-6-metoxy-1,4-benzoquinol methylase